MGPPELWPEIIQGAALLERNGRWGTCAECPRAEDGSPLPETCKNTNREDHRLGAAGWNAMCGRWVRRALAEGAS